MSEITEPCELHELIGCTICSGKDRREREQAQAEEEAVSRPFVSRYDGQCPGCNLPIRAAVDTIVLHGSPRRAWHSHCIPGRPWHSPSDKSETP